MPKMLGHVFFLRQSLVNEQHMYGVVSTMIFPTLGRPTRCTL